MCVLWRRVKVMLNCFGSSRVLTPVSRQCLKSQTFSLCLSLVSTNSDMPWLVSCLDISVLANVCLGKMSDSNTAKHRCPSPFNPSSCPAKTDSSPDSCPSADSSTTTRLRYSRPVMSARLWQVRQRGQGNRRKTSQGQITYSIKQQLCERTKTTQIQAFSVKCIY